MPSSLHIVNAPIPGDVAPWVRRLARFGFAARGALFLLIGFIAARAAFAAGRPTGAAGALRELLRSGGRWLVLVVAIGLAMHALWRLFQAARDPEHRDGSVTRRFLYVISAVIHASLAFTAFQLWRGHQGSQGGGQKMLVAKLLSLPFGEVLVAVIGLGVIGYAIQQVVLAVRGDVAKELNIRGGNERLIVAVGRVGIASRGVVLGILGAFLIEAARRHDPKAAGGTDEVLKSFDNEWLLGAVAIGLFAFGLFQLANAAFRRLPVN